MKVEWDPEKALMNRSKHGVSFAEAALALEDPLALTIEDPSFDERRFITLACGPDLTPLVVVHTQRGENLRIISARRATARERKQYEGKTP